MSAHASSLSSSLGAQSQAPSLGTLRTLLKAWLYSSLAWGIFFFIFGWQVATTMFAPWDTILRMIGWDWLVWSLVTPMVFSLAVRFPFDRQKWTVSVPLHIVLCISTLLVIGIAHPKADFSKRDLSKVDLQNGDFPKDDFSGPGFPKPGSFRPPPPRYPFFGPMIFGPFLPIYLVILSAGNAYYFYRRGREREMRSIELAARLAEARLRALRMQIQPHFLFNSLNALGTLIQRDANAAEEMLAAISDFLRITLDDSSGQETPLRRELEFVLRYLAIEKIRFGERLNYSIEVPPEALRAMVPSLLLQPLIENAVRHGIEPNLHGGRIVVEAARLGSSLCLKISDNGPGMPENASPGVGLSNTRDRLRELYGESASLQTSSFKGTQIEIRLPYRLPT